MVNVKSLLETGPTVSTRYTILFDPNLKLHLN